MSTNRQGPTRAPTVDSSTSAEIAIVGIGCRMPGNANSPDAFWDLLVNGKDAIEPIPATRWASSEYYDPEPLAPGKMSTRWGGFLRDIDQFDAEFFGVTPREAASMDPQHRLVLEVALEALENYGHPAQQLAGTNTGVFLGIYSSDYASLELSSLSQIDAYSGVGTARSVAANRLSYVLDLHGPSIAIDTSCSSSLVAVHLACQSLQTGDCDIALAGGVNVLLSPAQGIAVSKALAMAPDGRCKPFDKRADGIVRGEGCGIIVLKRLADALANEDHIMGVVCASAVNQDGRSNGITAPNPLAQAQLIRRAIARANLSDDDISYIECHGTGTALGDPIELQAIVEAAGDSDNKCLLGSVKSNLGHLEAASGAAGLIKTILALQHDGIPPTLNYKDPNPHFDLRETRFQIATEYAPWPSGRGARYAGVSSFGLGGTNAHVILSDLPKPETRRQSASRNLGEFILPISGHSDAALRSQAVAFRDFLASESAQRFPLGDICYTASARRSHHVCRLAVTGRTAADLVERLDGFVQNRETPGIYQGGSNRPSGRIAFAFPPDDPHAEELECWLAANWPGRLDRGNGDGAMSLSSDRGRLCLTQVAIVDMLAEFGVAAYAAAGEGAGSISAAYAEGRIDRRGTIERLRAEPISRSHATSDISSLHVDCDLLLVIGGETACEGIRRQLPPRQHELAHALMQLDIGGKVAAARGLAKLYACGASLNWSRICGSGVLVCGLPSYSWQRRRHWTEHAPPGSKTSIFAPDAAQLQAMEGADTGADAGLYDLEWEPHGGAAENNLGRGQTASSASADVALLRVYAEIGPRIDAICATAMDQALGELGWLPGIGPAADGQSRMPRPIADRYKMLAARWLKLLEELQLVRRQSSEGVMAVQPAFRADLEHDIRSLKAEFPECGSELELLARSIRRLPQILSGEQDPLQVLFNDEAMTCVEDVYRNSLFSRCLHPLVCDVVVAQVERMPDDRPISILEIGGGTGGTTRALLEALSGKNVTYLFSDISIFFLGRAKSNFSHHPHVGFCRYDINSPPERQGLEKGRFDVIVAGNVLHTAADPRFSIAQVRSLLAPDGLLVVLEGTGNRNWADLTFGLTSGWTHGDKAPRSMSVQDWMQTFAEAGLESMPLYASEGYGTALLFAAHVGGSTRYPLASRSASVVATASGGHDCGWLVLVDEGGFGDRVADRLEARGECCWRIGRGSGFRQLSERRFSVSAESALDVERVVAAWRAQGRRLRGVVHIWSFDAELAEDAGEQDVEALTRLSCGSALHVLQALAKAGLAPAPKLWIVTRRAQAIAGGAVAVAQAPVWGLGRVAANEHPELWGGLVDVEGGDADAGCLADEIAAGRGEDWIGYRGGQRYLARLSRCEAKPAAAVTLHGLGSYLISGGLGGIGLSIAQWLAAEGAGRVVLVSRRGIDGHPEAAAAIAAIRARGCDVWVRPADVSRRAELARVVAEIGPDLRGVIHAAGVVDDRLLLHQDWPRLARVFAPKIQGAWNLHLLTKSINLDFFVLFSSASVVIGPPSQANHAAGNAFMDALAAMRRIEGLPALTIGWGLWSETGAAVEREILGKLLERGLKGISTADGLAILRTLLSLPQGQLIVLPLDADFADDGADELTIPQFSSRILNGTDLQRTAAARRLIPEASREKELTHYLQAQIGELLDALGDTLDTTQRLELFGFDSLMSIELRRRIETDFNVRMPLLSLLGKSSIVSISEQLRQLLETLDTSAARPLEQFQWHFAVNSNN